MMVWCMHANIILQDNNIETMYNIIIVASSCKWTWKVNGILLCDQ